MSKHLLSELPYFNQRMLNSLKKRNIITVSDFLYYYPNKYDDYTITPIEEIELNETVTIEGFILSKPSVHTIRPKLTIMNFYIDVKGSKIRISIFNRQFYRTKIKYGEYVRVTGKFDKNLKEFTASEISFDEFANIIEPRYNLDNISDDKIMELKAKVYYDFIDEFSETLPQDLIDKHNLVSLKQALKYINIPESKDEVSSALKRLKYEELLSYQLKVKYMLYQRKNNPEGIIINYDEERVKNFIDNLSFQLTVDQEQAVQEILEDMKSEYKMNRLLQGEVGSGKTIVAAISLLAAVSAGFQGALMVPTEVLAYQHFETFKGLFESLDINICLLTASIPTKEKEEVLADIASGKIDIAIGTHSLFQRQVTFKNLGLVITDEEHRFGVNQRVSIVGKGYLIDHLKMSATPIPRSLAISLLGDTDLSTLKTLPGKRKEPITEYIPYEERHKVFAHIKDQILVGRQVYIITPMIEESDKLELSNAIDVYENTKKYYQDIAQVGLIHGRLSHNEKQAVMDKFYANEIQILIATSVIEVGVNVVNATTMVILDADRFGIAQLHQMRGRVRRSDYQSYCFLISRSEVESSMNRLKLVAETSDGFILAEEDLKYRGPGDFFGVKQSGEVDFKLASIITDEELFILADEDADLIINSKELFNDPDYEYLLSMVHKNYLSNKKMLE